MARAPRLAGSLFLALAFSVLSEGAAAAGNACNETHIVGVDPGCPSGLGTCSITQVWNVTGNCTFNFGTRTVEIASTGEINTQGWQVTIQSGTFNVLGGGLIDGTEVPGRFSHLHIQAGGSFSVQATGSAGRIQLDKTTSEFGLIDIDAVGDVTVQGQIKSQGTTGAQTMDINITSSQGDIIVTSAAVISSSGARTAGAVTLTASAGRVDVDAALEAHAIYGADISVTAAEDVELASINSSGGTAVAGFNDGGDITVTAGWGVQLLGAIEANGGGDTDTLISLGGSGGAISVTANDGDITLAGSINTNGASDGGAGGAVTMSAYGGNLTTSASITSLGAAPDGAGGDIDLSATGSVTIGSSIVSEGTGEDGGDIKITADTGTMLVSANVESRGGSPDLNAGSISLEAGGNVTIQGTIKAQSTGTGSGGSIGIASVSGNLSITTDVLSNSNTSPGSIDLSAGGSVELNGAATVSANGTNLGTSGGSISVTAGTTILSSMSISATGKSTSSGGSVSMLAGGNITIEDPVSVDGTQAGNTGGTVTMIAGQTTTGTLDIKANVTANGGNCGPPCGAGGVAEFTGCALKLWSGVQVQARGESGHVTFTGRETLTINGTVDVRRKTGGTNHGFIVVRFRPGQYVKTGSSFQPSTAPNYVEQGTLTACDGCVTASCSDSNECTVGDTCSRSVCTPGSAITCTASDQCHDAGTCDPATGTCSNPNKPNGTSCTDGDTCTQTDTCQSGTCTGANPVVCTPLDQCHDAGTCDTGTGVCSNPDKPNGTGCNDSNACTQADTCQSGACTGANPVVCTPLDQCHDAGTCNTGTGVCSNPNKPNGTSCTDGNACTQADTCQSGSCTGANPVVCTPLDQCHDAGTCDTGTGVCSNPDKPNGTGCNDSNACTQTDTCQGGSCTGSNPVTCSPLDQCHEAGTCNTGTGVCSDPPAPNGASCNDGDVCTPTDTCQAGICVGTGDTCGVLTRVRTIPAPNDVPSRFGLSLGVVGTDLVVGAPFELIGSTVAGAGYVFDPSTGAQLAQLVSPNPGANDLLGFLNSTTGIGADTVVLGAPNADVTTTNAGAAFVFQASTGTVTETLQVAPFVNQFLGVSVGSHDGDAVVVDLDPAGVRAYRLDVLDGSVVSSHASAFCVSKETAFISLASAGDDVALGLPYASTCGVGGAPLGSRLCVFDAATGTLEFPCLADTEPGLGFALAARGDDLLVTKLPAQAGTGGTAQLLDAASGTELQTYTTADPPNTFFGIAISPVGDGFVGVTGGHPATNETFVELFDADTGTLTQSIPNPFPPTFLFGYRLATIGDSLVVGAPVSDGIGAVGVVTVYAPCGNGTVDAGETCDDGNQSNGDGCSATCQIVPALCGNNTLDAGEACDDGNTAPGDCCAEDCQFEPEFTPCAEDGNPCTNNQCDGAGTCTHPDNTAPCDDGDACTLNDICGGGTCTSGVPLTCNDNNVCTDDTCNPASGCVFTPNTAPCDDGVLCTTSDVCSGGTCGGTCAEGAACGPNCSPSMTCQLVSGTCTCQ